MPRHFIFKYAYFKLYLQFYYLNYDIIGPQGNHGEDVKENYYYLDSTPTHSYMKSMYKYPMTHYPYDELVSENMKRDGGDQEYELEDTGLFYLNEYKYNYN